VTILKISNHFVGLGFDFAKISFFVVRLALSFVLPLLMFSFPL